MIAALLAYVPWLAVDVLVEAAVAARLAMPGNRLATARIAAAAALTTHGLATLTRNLLPHDVVVAEAVWAAVDYVLWRIVGQLPAGRALRFALATNLAAAVVATLLWYLFVF